MHKQGTHRIPSFNGFEPIGAAARVRAVLDVHEATASISVQPDVKEAERGLASRDSVVIKQCDYTRHDLHRLRNGQPRYSRREEGDTHGRRTACARHKFPGAIDDDRKVVSLGGDVGDSPARSAAQQLV